MRDSDRSTKLEQAQADITEIVRRMPTAQRNISAWSGRGYPTSSMPDSSIGTSRGVSDPVGLEVERGRNDQIREDGQAADADLLELCGILARLRRHCYRYTEKVEGMKAEVPECKWCAHAGRFSIPFRDELCRWHHRFRTDWGFEPAVELTRLYLDRSEGYITENVILRFHPNAQRRSA